MVSVLFMFGLLVVGGCASTGSAKADSPNTEPPRANTRESTDEQQNISAERPDGFAEAEVMDVVSTVGGHAVLLGDGEDKMVVPIFIDQSQAMVIKLRLERRRYSRPLTHDLLDKVVDKLGGKVVKVHIDAVKSGVFVGTVYVQGPDKLHEVDARSSDAVAIAMGNEVPIFVADRVFKKAGVSRKELERGEVQPRERFEEGQKPGEEKQKKEGNDEEQPFY
jgi:bifunctional DNase/RNase